MLQTILKKLENLKSGKDISWEKGNKWLQLALDIKETGNFEFLGKSQLLTVPYAMYAKSAGSFNGNSRSADGDWEVTGNNMYYMENNTYMKNKKHNTYIKCISLNLSWLPPVLYKKLVKQLC